ncbi:MAG: DEAD/DEAH box helicase [Candidatus Gastranaerophilales bacterium]|nr:DEAD/DEAH box helicase [Candidatus Gastranaerophilales bacterium]
MITPVRNISFNSIKKQNKINNTTQNSPINNQAFTNSSKLNFTGYLSIKPKVKLEYGIENNFFKLPKITLEDGTTTQIQPDNSQKKCAKQLCEGKNVLFDAPTGMGKTSVAHFAINKNLFEGKKTIYTVPIKALANDKYNEFCKIYGEENVGVLTGDRKINAQAPIVIETTEIFNLQSQSMTLNDALKTGTVVYDEGHYLGDEERGIAWEQSMINAASRGIQILTLSATIGNASEVASWIGKIEGARPTVRISVPSEERPVPLVWKVFRTEKDRNDKLSPIMYGEIDLSGEFQDLSYDIINLIYQTEMHYFEKKHRANQDKSQYNNEFLKDSTYKEEIRPKLERALGENWINADFSDEKTYKKLIAEFPSLIQSDMQTIQAIASKSGINVLSDRQKAALELLYKKEYETEDNYQMTDDDYDFIYNQLKMGIGEGQNNFKFDTESFKKRLAREFRTLDKIELDFISQAMARGDVKSVNAIHENWGEDNYPRLINKLQKEDMLPAIVFKLSQKGCEEAAMSLYDSETEYEYYVKSPEGKEIKLKTPLEILNQEEYEEAELQGDYIEAKIKTPIGIVGWDDIIVKDITLDNPKVNLLTPQEKQEIREIIEKYEKQGVYLGSNPQKQLLLNGIGVHHAGRLPQYKKLIEELFSKKLIKVVFATSTLGAGINMPTRTVVITGTSYPKQDPNSKEMIQEELTANEFHQMAGRAGRRGIDKVGNVVLYNLHTPFCKFNKEERKDKTENFDELWHAYKLMDMPADDIRSSFRPQPVMLANYYARETTPEGLWKIIKQTFKVHNAKDRDKADKQMHKKFENYTQVLLKQGYLMKNHKKELVLTPKGELLTQAQGMNPLMMASLLYDEKLAKMSPIQLAQIAAHIQGSSEQSESKELAELVASKLKYMEIGTQQAVSLIQFEQTKGTYDSIEQKVLKALNESRVNKLDIKQTDSTSGLIGYLFASFNSLYPDESINNFEQITNSGSIAAGSDSLTNSRYENKMSEGNVYKIIAGSISTLKQMIRICDYALSNEESFPNAEYFKIVKENAKEAIKLLDKEPINNDPNYANKSSNI